MGAAGADAQGSDPTDPSRWSARGALTLGLASVFVLVFGLGAWAALATISGAVVAPGRLKVETNRQVVQHLDGGVVAEINVKEGDLVEAGEVLIRLDDQRVRAELAIIESQLFEILARIGRLEAEQEGLDAPRFDPELLAEGERRVEVAALIEGQSRLFAANRDTRARETEQLRERQIQIRDEIEGAAAQRASLDSQLAFIVRELADQQSLLDRGLTQASRVLALEREKARLEGEIGAVIAQIAQARGRITEIDIQIIGLDATVRQEAISQVRDLRTREAELRERRLSAQETLADLAIRAPRSGQVLGLGVHTVRAVIRPAEPVMHIVPRESALVVEARIEPADVDQVWPGQPARLRFSAFNQRTTPEINARVSRISADALTDQATGANYFALEIALDETALEALGGLTLVPGMPVEAFIRTGERTPLAYLTKPLTDYFNRSMREQ
jgi:HlyD family secretion protein